MTNCKMPDNIDDKLSTIKYNCTTESHLIPDMSKCRRCKSKACTYFCPANVYAWEEDSKLLVVRHENCLECGACRIGCEKHCIEWKYPKPGYGVTFKLG